MSSNELRYPFDQGIFLVHYNRGREAFQDGRLGEARKELEQAQKLRPNDTEVLNLLGLVYFKTSSYPEAEVIYRRLVETNPDVFTLHSNLGLIYFKQGMLEPAERHLLRAVQLRPNYAKSHLYLGLLYRQRRKLGLAAEHFRFAGADKLLKEVELEMHGGSAAAPAEGSVPSAPAPQPATPARQAIEPSETIEAPIRHIQAAPAPAGGITEAAHSAARKLQEAVDETPEDQPRIDLERRLEGASRTFALHENGFLEINFDRSVYVKRGTVSSYSGNLRFAGDTGLAGTTAGTMVRVEGPGRLFVFERGRKTFLLDLNEEFIYVEGGHLLALEDSLSFRVEPIYDPSYQRKIDTVKIFGKGSLAISTSIEPLTMRVSRQYPLSVSSSSLVAWTGNLIPSVVDAHALSAVMIDSEGAGFKIRFDGDGVAVAEQ